MRKYRIGITCFLATLLVAFIAGCGHETVTIPAVVSVTPAQSATNVAINTTITATFSVVMSPATISTATFTVSAPGAAAVAGAVTYAGSVATFTPTASLAFNTVYTATISAAATNPGGTHLAANYIWTFTTITPPPVVITTAPTDTATGVPINQVVSATFNESMSCATLASPATTFLVKGPGATAVTGTVSCSGAVASFTPGTNLAYNTIYTATISTGAQSLAGTPMAGNYLWHFRTSPALTAPTVISTVPANKATGVPINQDLAATFSGAMNPATIDAATFTLAASGGVAVTGKVTYVAAGSVALFAPSANLAANTLYTATITTGAMDLEGAPLAGNFTWTFTTGIAADLVKPTVISTVPKNGDTEVPLNQSVSATFSKAMNPATMDSTSFTVAMPGGVAVAGQVAYAAIGNSVTFTPESSLAANTVFTATVTTGAKDLAGNALATDFAWTFTTGATLNSTPPEIDSTTPENGASNVPLNQAVSATFSAAMDPLTITSATFQLTVTGGASIAATVTYNPITFVATLTPRAPLTANASYMATITSGATDLNGNSLGNTGDPNPWNFSTGATLAQGPIDLGSASLFGGFGGTAGVTNMGIHTVINGNLGTTGVSTLVTGFHDNGPNCVYTETPLNVGHVNGVIDTAPPPPTVGCPTEGTAVTAAVAAQAALDSLTAYNALVAIPNGLDVSVCPGCGGGGAGELGNRTLAPGVYFAASGSYDITMGDLTLDAKGDANAVWVFQMATTLTVGTPASNRNVLLVNGALAKNVFWQVGSAATINGILGGGTMQGTIIAQEGVSISTAGVDALTTINGRALVLTGPVTMVNTVINVPAP